MNPQENAGFKYFAFISYSRKDSREAKWLQRRLEWFRFPVTLVEKDRLPFHPRYIRPVYRDKTNLEVDHAHYWENIKQALEQSRFLIVLGSPDAARSGPVDLEVRHFLETREGAAEFIVPVVLRGRVGEGGPEECLCPALRGLGSAITDRNLPTMVSDDGQEAEAWENGFIGLASYLLKLHRTALSDHVRREERRRAARTRLTATVFGLLAVVAAGLGVFARLKQLEAVREFGRAEKALEEANQQLERSKLEEGRAWLERARTAERDNNPFLAILLAGRAVGFRGYGWKEEDQARFGKTFPPLLSQPMKSAMNQALDSERKAELEDVLQLISRQSSVGLPLWSNPVNPSHEERVSSVAFSPDGSHIVLGSMDGTVKTWDASTGLELTTFSGHQSAVQSVAFSPDGSLFASGASDNTVKLWDASTGQELFTLTGHSAIVTSIAFSPDCSLIASGSYDDTVKLWDTSTGRELNTLQGHSSIVKCVAFSPDGSVIASGSWDETVKVWDAASSEELATFSGHSSHVTSVAFSPDGTRIASGSWDNTVKLWDTVNARELATLRGHTGGVNCVAFSPDGSRIASGGADGEFDVSKGEVKFWDAATGMELATLRGHSRSVTSVVFSSDGSRIASVASGYDNEEVGELILWDAASGREQVNLRGNSSNVLGVAFSPDGSRIVLGARDETVNLWDASIGKKLATLHGHSGIVNCVAFSPDGTQVASGSDDETVKLWGASSGREMVTLRGHSDGVSSVAFNLDGRHIASGSHDETVKLWDAVNAQELATLRGHSGIVTSVTFSPDGSVIASGSWDETVKLWDAASGEELATLKGHSSYVSSVAFSPDGTRIASGSWDATVKLWDTASGEELNTLQGHTEEIHSVAFSPDGSYIVSGAGTTEDFDPKYEVKLWDTSTGRELDTLRGHSGTVTSVAFSPDGNRIASGSRDDTVKLWDVAFRPDLMHLQRQNLIRLEGREITWRPDASQPGSVSFTPAFHRQDELAALASANLTKSQRDQLRMKLVAKSGRWRAAISSWNTLKAPDITTRQTFLRLLLTQALEEVEKDQPTAILAILLPEITAALSSEAIQDPRVSLPLVSLLNALTGYDDTHTFALFEKVRQTAPSKILEAIQ